MKLVVRSIFFHLLFVGSLCSCNQRAKSIEVSENLLNSTSIDGTFYVLLLNESVDGDSVAIVDFLKINTFEDALGYEHGFVVFQLMKSIGDARFSKALGKLNALELRNVGNYLEVGLDNDKENTTLYEHSFPLSRFLLEER